MLHNFPLATTTKDVLNRMAESKFDFHLTGSRYFGNHNYLSDYDFMVADTEEVKTFLASLGFRVLSTSKYLDCATIQVFRHENVDPMIDVQITRPLLLEKKLTVQQVLTCENEFRFMTKGQQRLVWNVALRS